jgi:hypothetical protein
MYKFITCLRCGAKKEASSRSHSGLCDACSQPHYREGAVAHRRVGYAIRAGRLQRAAERLCADCGQPARMYDHRDYTKPLDVEPVCGSCNQHRGAAFDSVYRPA